MSLSRALFALAASAAATLLPAFAGRAAADDIGHERAYELLKEGRIRALPDIIREIGKQHPGDILEVELEFDDGLYIYEIKLLGPRGRVQEIEVDASTGKILDVEDDD